MLVGFVVISSFPNMILFICALSFFFLFHDQLARSLSILFFSKNQFLAHISWILLFLHINMLWRAFHISTYRSTSFFLIAATELHIMGVPEFI